MVQQSLTSVVLHSEGPESSGSFAPYQITTITFHSGSWLPGDMKIWVMSLECISSVG